MEVGAKPGGCGFAGARVTSAASVCRPALCLPGCPSSPPQCCVLRPAATWQVWCLAVGSLGDIVLSGSHDRSLRRWERTEEPFFIEEEKEKRLESLFEADLEVGARERDGVGG